MTFSPVHTTMYLVWDPHASSLEAARAQSQSYGALDAASAARIFAERVCFARETWPVELRVLNGDTQRMYDVLIDRKQIWEYSCATNPKEVKP